MLFLLSLQFLMTERMYIATLLAKESNVLSLFGFLCSGIAFFFFTEGVFFFKRKRRRSPWRREYYHVSSAFLSSLLDSCQNIGSTIVELYVRVQGASFSSAPISCSWGCFVCLFVSTCNYRACILLGAKGKNMLQERPLPSWCSRSNREDQEVIRYVQRSLHSTPCPETERGGRWYGTAQGLANSSASGSVVLSKIWTLSSEFIVGPLSRWR